MSNDYSLYEAYREAWRERTRVGDANERLFTDALARHEITPPYSGAQARGVGWFYEQWRDGITPRRLGRREIRGTLRETRNVVRRLVEILRSDNTPDWVEIPDGGGGVSWDESNWGGRQWEDLDRKLQIRLDPEAGMTFERVMSLKPDKKGRREAEFWVRPRSESARAEILVGRDRVGWTMLETDDWRNALRLAVDQVYVDGSFMLRSEADGWRLTGIRATFPPPSSG